MDFILCLLVMSAAVQLYLYVVKEESVVLCFCYAVLLHWNKTITVFIFVC